MIPTGPRGPPPPQLSPSNSTLTPNNSSEIDGPLNLSKPKGGKGGGGLSNGSNNSSRSSPSNNSANVPPGLVLPSTFMPFATFPLPSGKIQL